MRLFPQTLYFDRCDHLQKPKLLFRLAPRKRSVYSPSVILRRATQFRVIAISVALLAGGSYESLFAQPRLAPAIIDLPVTKGLIRWWPNLFDVRDEISGQEGVVMGVLPPVETGADDEAEFGQRTGWVQLKP